MDLQVLGGQILQGTLRPSGNKNAVVAVLPATILITEPVILTNVPDIPDVQKLIKIMQELGSVATWNKEEQTVILDNSALSPKNITKENVGGMKGTTLLWGPMIGRFQHIVVEAKSGGCTLGVRPVEPQFKALRDLGVKIDINEQGMVMDGTQARAQTIWLMEMSPTVTENAVMLAVSLPGTTRLIGCASEPHVQDLCNMLNSAGAEIHGIGSSILEIEGGKQLHGVTFKISSDHHEIATYLALGAISGGEVRVEDAIPQHFPQINATFANLGVNVEYEGDTALVRAGQSLQIKETFEGQPQVVRAQPWPGFPVDILPLFIPIALASPHGQVLFHNWMYDAGLFWTTELRKMGANIVMADPHRVMVTGGKRLKAATLEAPYIIRAVIAIVMTALLAEGTSKIMNADAMYRAHPHFIENLQKLGTVIKEEATGYPD